MIIKLITYGAPVRGIPVGIFPSCLVRKKLEWWGYRQWKNFEDTCNRLDGIPACNRQTDGQTSCDGIVRAMHTRRMVKMVQYRAILTTADHYKVVYDRFQGHSILRC